MSGPPRTAPNGDLRSDAQPVSQPSSRDQTLVLVAALLGWMFDGFEMGLFPLIGNQALQNLLPNAPRSELDGWFSAIIAVFLVGAAAGGVVFGWLGDKIGRVRAMAAAILVYSLLSGLCGFATAPWQIALLRFLAALGMGGEWSLGVALVNEVWPNKSRAIIAGLIGAAANLGYLIVALLSIGLSRVVAGIEQLLTAGGCSPETIVWATGGDAWRILMMCGALPAVLTFIIRLWVPESHRWEESQRSGEGRHWMTVDLVGVLAGVCGALLVVAVWSPLITTTWVRLPATAFGLLVTLAGFLYPVLQYLSRVRQTGGLDSAELTTVFQRLLLGAALAGIPLLGTWGTIQHSPRWANQMTAAAAEKTSPETVLVAETNAPATSSIPTPVAGATPTKLVPASRAGQYTQMASSFGAIVGTILAAWLCDVLGRRVMYALLCLGALASTAILFQTQSQFGPSFLFCVWLAGVMTASFYGWLPLYLPELYRTSVRATSQGFAFNFGRVIAAVGTLQLPTLMQAFGGSFPRAAGVVSLIYLFGLIVIWLGPETRGRPLPD